ncbi:hypothetical protein ACEQ8H_006891 [Pleosporales sp. CAS-2024a]
MSANEIYQYSLVNALMAGVSDNGITVSTLLTKGNQGLGTFVRMDGELLLLDDKVYQLQAEGKIRVAGGEDRIPYAAAIHFQPQRTLRVALETKDALSHVLDRGNPHAGNLFMAYRINGRFAHVKCRTVKGQEYPGQPLSELGKNQFVAEYTDITGTMIGFRAPSAWQGFTVAGHHLHFIDKDRKVGGHVLELRSIQELDIGIATVKDLHIELPTSETFNDAKLTTDDAGLKEVEG